MPRLPFVSVFLLAAALVAAPAPAHAAAPLGPEATREAVARMTDAEVRKLLLEQLDRGKAAAAPAKDTDLVDRVKAQAARVRGHVVDVGDGLRDLPRAFVALGRELGAQAGEHGWLALGGFALAMLAAGMASEAAWRGLSRRWRGRLREGAPRGFVDAVLRVVLRTLMEVAHVVVFGLGALALFLVAWRGGPLTNTLLLASLAAVVLVRLGWALADFLLAPGRPDEKLIDLDDDTGRMLVTRFTLVVALASVNLDIAELLVGNGADASVTSAFTVVVSTAVYALALSIVWRLRQPIAQRIREAAGGSPIGRWAADLWPAAAILYLSAVFVGRLMETLEGIRGRGEGLASLAILVAMPVLDHALSRALALGVQPAPGVAATRLQSLAQAYEPVLRRLIHIGVVVLGFALLAGVWDLDLFALAERSLGGRIASSLIGIFIVVLLAYVAWDAVRTAIDRRLAAEGDDEHAPTSRLRTLLPLLRMTLAITIFTMAVMSVLAAMGVDILPLLAGASVIGVAIGFGSQTLVRDIVSGAFFLMDDAFRLGEYIEVGDAKGRIEKITLRSLFLRHHRGALNILPYGEIKRLRNTSRDWMIMVLEFKLALETDLKKVKKLIKTIAEEVAADPELGPELLEPIKSQGVLTTDDSSITVRVKYMARPGDGPFLIRRVAYEKILKAFRDNGVEFAGKRVSVYVPPEAAGDRRTLAGAAALQVLGAGTAPAAKGDAAA